MFYYDKTEKDIIKIIYWYDHNIKLYTFQFMDNEENEIREADYSSKNTLTKTKDFYFNLYGIKPIKG